MTVARKDAWRAQYALNQKINLGLSRSEEINREHLPLIDPSPLECVTGAQFNQVVEFLANATDSTPFGQPHYWQIHVRRSFSRWLRSWKV